MIRQLDPLISLPATDPARAVRFYTEVLGCRLVHGHEESDFYLFQLPEGHAWLGVHRHPGPLPAPDPLGTWIWIWVTNLDEARRRLAGQGVRLLGEPRDMGPGKEQVFVDTEGNPLRLYEPLDRVERSVLVEAPAEAVFQALTTATAIERWFSAIDNVRFEARSGGTVSFIDPAFGQVLGAVTEWEPPHRVVVRFSQNWPRRLEYTLATEGSGTRLRVLQTEFDQIRDRDFGIPGMIEHLDQALALLVALTKAGGMLYGAIETAKSVREGMRREK